MLRSVKSLHGFKIEAIDGKLGKSKDFLFDDEKWTVRYLVVDTGGWLVERKVLVSPIALETPDWASKTFPVKLTKEQIEKCPPIEERAPVSRQYEINWYRYYGWPDYWSRPGMWGPYVKPSELFKLRKDMIDKNVEPESCHVRSTRELENSYKIKANDGDIGHVEDFIIDDDIWTIRYVVIDTRDWLPGKKVIVPPLWFKDIDWANRQTRVDLDVEEIKNCPEYVPSKPVNRAYEEALYDYYGRPVYW